MIKYHFCICVWQSVFPLLLFSNNENSTEHYTATEQLKVHFPEKSLKPESEEESQIAGLRDKKNDGTEMCVLQQFNLRNNCNTTYISSRARSEKNSRKAQENDIVYRHRQYGVELEPAGLRRAKGLSYCKVKYLLLN